MKTKMKWKHGIDILMSIVLLLLMAYQVTGDIRHEIFGTAMLVLFITHHILNLKWYGNLFKGRYTPQRLVNTVINAALLAAMLSLAYSGIVLSRHVFDFLPIKSGMALSRVLHLSASYWGFVLMSVHIGLHWSMVNGMLGSPETEAWRSEDETQHPVTVSDFYIGMYEVTQAEYRNTMGNNPSYFSGDNLPVESVSWLDAVAYCNARSEAEGLNPVYAIRSVSGWNVA